MALEELVAELNGEIAQFESQKLSQVKGELEAFLKKKAAVVTSYQDKFVYLKDEWVCMDKSIIDRATRIDAKYGKDDREKFYFHYVCPTMDKIEGKNKQVHELWHGHGGNEREQYYAKRSTDRAKDHLDKLIGNADEIASVQKDNDALLQQVDDAIKAGSLGLASYVLWFRLLPQHKQIAPEEGKFDGLLAGSPSELCRDAHNARNKDGDRSAEKPAETPASAEHPPRRAPWLIAPEKYGLALEDAWDAYRKSKARAGKAEAAFAKDPDDLPTVTKTLADLKKAEDKTIRDGIAAGATAHA